MDQYTYSVAWSEEDQVFVARVAEFPLMGAHGDTAEEALAELRVAVTAAVAWMREEGQTPPEPGGIPSFACTTPI